MAADPELRPGQSQELLKELHILTRDGKLNQDSRRKLKQVNHLCGFIEPLLRQVIEEYGEVNLVDHGAGKSYLGFILYDLFLKSENVGRVFGVEARTDLVSKSRALAQRLGFSRMAFLDVSVIDAMESPEIPSDVHIVTALHACDTATDDAIRFGLARKARFIVVAPCCQAEVAAVMRQHKSASLGASATAELWRHPIHTREFGSLVSNVLRCLLLEAHGYRLNVTELVGWEHSMKNELIVARRDGAPRGNARARAAKLMSDLGLMDLERRFLY